MKAYQKALYEIMKRYYPENPLNGQPEIAYISSQWLNNPNLIEVDLSLVIETSMKDGDIEYGDDMKFSLKFSQTFRGKQNPSSR